MMHADKMVPGSMIYIPGFIKIFSGTEKLIEGIHIQTDTQIGW
jgi:hypothetical protein